MTTITDTIAEALTPETCSECMRPFPCEYVYHWPEDEIEMHRSHTGTFTERAADMEAYRRRKAAQRVTQALVDAGMVELS